MAGKWLIICIVVAALMALGLIMAGCLNFFIAAQGNVALIPVKGLIAGSGQYGVASAARIIDNLREASEDSSIRAVILDIDSPGGSPVASEAVAAAVKRLNKPVVAVIQDSGTSGAYWIASAADRIFASRMSVTGSIGVIASYPEIVGLLESYNVTYRRLVSGKYKDIGSPAKRLAPDEQQLLQEKIDRMQEIFIADVAENRGLNKSRIDSSAMFYLGIEALDNGLIDEIGGIEEAKQHIARQLNMTAELVEFGRQSFFETFFDAVREGAFYLGKGVGGGLIEDAGIRITG